MRGADELGLRVVRGLARLLLFTYPAAFRREFGSSFLSVAVDRWWRERRTGSPAWTATIATLRVLVSESISGPRAARVPAGPPLQRRALMFDRLIRDIRYASRGLVRSPLLALVATLSLAVGIGANAAVFTVANGLFLAPTAGIRDVDRLVDIGRSVRGQGFDTVSYLTFADLRDRVKSFEGVFGYDLEPRALSLAVADGAELVRAQFVSGGFFDVLGVRPALGTAFHAADEQVGTPLRAVVASHGYWLRHLGGDRTAIGRPLTLNGDPFTLAGVAPEGFQGPTIIAPDLWVPLTAGARGMPSPQQLRSRGGASLIIGARLAPGVSIAQARQETDAFMRALAKEYPSAYEDIGLVVTPTSRVPGQVGAFVLPFVGVLMALVGLILLVACANLGSLLLARAAGRSREVAVRLALGASRSSLARMFLVETLVLFLPGAILGLLIAATSTRLLDSVSAQLPFPIHADFPIDWRVLTFTIAITLATAIITGLAPALQAIRPDLVPDLKMDASAPRRQRLRRIFVSAQLACCLVLMVMAGLLLRALHTAATIDPGFTVDRIDVVSVDLTLAGYTDEQLPGAREELGRRLSAIPGVAAVGAASSIPLSGEGIGMGGLRKAGDPASAERVDTDWNFISPEFLPTLGIGLVRGRNFTAADRSGAPNVVIVNERLARDLWPGDDPVGKVLENGDFRPGQERITGRLTVVGVAPDAKYRWVGESPRQFVFAPIAQYAWNRAQFFLRRSEALAPEASLQSAVRAALHDFNRNLPLVSMRPFQQYADVGLLPQRIAASLAGSLGSIALLLGAIGVYGITAFLVSSRTREIGIRVALGADRGRVTRLVLMQGLRLAAAGGLVGLAVAIAASQLLSSLLFGVSSLDPLAFGGTMAALFATTAAATYLPARRAARVNPVVALRNE